MHTVNNLYLTAGEPFKRFVKTVEHPVTGWRLDAEGKGPVEFVLVSPKPEFNYDDEVLEVYSEKEFQFLKQRNRYLFQSGLIKEFTGEPDEVDLSNTLTDDEIFAIANTRLPNELKRKLNDITSHVTVKRVVLTAKEIGRPKKIIDLIEERLQQLSV